MHSGTSRTIRKKAMFHGHWTYGPRKSTRQVYRGIIRRWTAKAEKGFA